MRRLVVLLAVLAAALVSATPSSALVPREPTGNSVLERMTVEPAVAGVGDVLTMRGTGCVDPDTGTAAGMSVRWVAALPVEPRDWSDEVPEGAAHVAVGADGSFAFAVRVGQPPALVRSVIAWCVRDASNEPFHLYGPDPDLQLVAPRFRLDRVTTGGQFTFVSPCAVGRTGQLVVTLWANWFLPYYQSVRVAGPVRVGQRIVQATPAGLNPGDWNASLTCSVSDGGQEYSVFDAGVHVYPRDLGHGASPPASLRPVRSRVEVQPGWGGSLFGQHLNAEVVAISAAPSAKPYGYYLAAADGGVFTYEGAKFHGSAAGLLLRHPIVDIAADPQGRGYWLVASDGGVFAFGVPFLGSAAPLRLRHPVVAIVPTRTGGGYWLVASDGSVYSFGDAPFHGAATSRRHARIVDAGRSGDGYVLLGADGGVFTFGAPFHGSAVGRFASRDPAVAIVTSDSGYRVFSAGGDHAGFGDAPGGPEMDGPVRWVIDVASTGINAGGNSATLAIR